MRTPLGVCSLRAALAMFVVLPSVAGCAVSTDLVLGDDAGAVTLLNGSCQETLTTSGFTFHYCADYIGLTPDQVSAIQMTCTAGADAGTGVSANGTYSTGTCDHTGAIGGCAIASGGFMTTLWWFPSMGPGMDLTMFQSQCAAQHGTWITP